MPKKCWQISSQSGEVDALDLLREPLDVASFSMLVVVVILAEPVRITMELSGKYASRCSNRNRREAPERSGLEACDPSNEPHNIALHQTTAILSPYNPLEITLNNKTVLRGLRNIGPTIADRLDTVGLKTVGDLKRVGPAKAFNLVKDAYPKVTIPVCYYLYSLQGALEDKHWDALTEATKTRLLREAGVKRVIRRSIRRVAAARAC